MQWNQDRLDNECVRVSTVSQGEKRLYICLGSQADIWDLPVHYLHKQNKSVPCLGAEDCPHHRSPIIQKSYAPCLSYLSAFRHDAELTEPLFCLGTGHSKRWLKRCVELTFNVRELTTMLEPGMVFALKRPPTNRNAKVGYHLFDQKIDVDLSQCFDVRRIMARVWDLEQI